MEPSDSSIRPTPAPESPSPISGQVSPSGNLPIDTLLSLDEDGIRSFGEKSARFIAEHYQKAARDLGEEVDLGAGVLRRLGYDTTELERAARALLRAEEALAIAEGRIAAQAKSGKAYTAFLVRLGWLDLTTRTRNERRPRRRRATDSSRSGEEERES